MAGVHAFDSDEKLSVLLEFVRVSENDFSKRGATAGVVHNVLHDSLDVSVEKKDAIKFKIQDVGVAEITYPLRSAKSKVLNAAGAILFEVWALKIVLPPRL